MLRVDIVIPTWKRPGKLGECLRSIHAQDYKGEIVVHPIEDTDRLFAFGVWNRFLRSWEVGDLFAYLCDDVTLSPGCISAAVSVFERRFPDCDGVVGFHQSNIEGQSGWCRSAMGCVGRAFADRFADRQLFCPDFSRFHADSELGQFARDLDKFEYCREASLVHYHPAHTPGAMDETHGIVREPSKVARDKHAWEIRRERGHLWGRDFSLVYGKESA